MREEKSTWAGRYLWQQRLLHGLCRFSRCHTMKSQTSCATYRFKMYFNSDVFKSPRSFWISMKSPWIAHQGRGEFKFPQNQPYFCFVMGKLHHNLSKGFYRVVGGIYFLLFLGRLNMDALHWSTNTIFVLACTMCPGIPMTWYIRQVYLWVLSESIQVDGGADQLVPQSCRHLCCEQSFPVGDKICVQVAPWDSYCFKNKEYHEQFHISETPL